MNLSLGLSCRAPGKPWISHQNHLCSCKPHALRDQQTIPLDDDRGGRDDHDAHRDCDLP